MKNFIKTILFISLCSTLSILFFKPSISYGGSIEIRWNKNTEPDLSGYNLYYGTSTGNYDVSLPIAAHLTSYEIMDLNEGTRYYIALTAVDFSNNESERSTEINGIAQPSSSTSSSTSTTTIVPYDGTELQNYTSYSGSVLPQEEAHFYIQVPPGQALLEVQLTGNPDADLYVRFNQPPSTALWDCRPYTDSSNEYCAINNPSPGTYYIMIQGYTSTVNFNLMAGFTNEPSTITTITSTSTSVSSNDTTPPTGTVYINYGQNITNSPNVILHLLAFDDNSEPLTKNALMSFSNDNQEWSDPEPYTTEKLWILTPGDGIKTVYVLFGDAAGNWMTIPVQDEILYEESQNPSCDLTVKLSASSISASSESLPFFAKENAIDGDLSTAWSTIFRLFQREEYFIIDLGEVKNITSLSMYSSRIFGTDFFPTNFQIQVSNDNINWIDMETVQGHSTPLDSISPDSWRYSALECRFLKVSITKARTFLFFFRVAQIAEIEVYGCDRNNQLPLLSEGNVLIQENQADHLISIPNAQRTPVERQVPTTPGKPAIKFIH